MNVVVLMGGLGNQLFQFALGLVLEKNGKQVVFDNSWYTRKGSTNPAYLRPYCLDKFQIPPLHFEPIITSNPAIMENKVGFNPGIFQMRNDNNFYGYWQYYSYYTDIFPILRQSLQIKSDFYTPEFLKVADKILDSNSVSVHVRVGDYVDKRKGQFNSLSSKYYFDAIKETEGDLYIFSDDIPWCKQTFDPKYFSRKIFFIDQADYLCFELMRFCQSHIVTNSTFCFWAALLDDNPNKRVICPKHYLGDSEEYSNEYRWPEEWIKIEDYKNV